MKDFNDASALAEQAMEWAMSFAPKLVSAIVILILGLWIAGALVGVFRRAAHKSKMDETLVPFLSSLVGWALKAVVGVSVVSALGVPTASFLTIFGAAGLAIGLALQGSLSNFAGGALLLIFRPYKVGDVIEAQGQIGSVKEIQIFTTVLVNGQNRRIIIPNGPMANGTILNYTAEGTARVDMVVGVDYGCDIDQAKSVLMKLLESNDKVLKEPAPAVEVLELADSAVNLVVRPHAKAADYWAVHFEVMAGAKRVLDEAGISIPFPQRDVHLHQAPTKS